MDVSSILALHGNTVQAQKMSAYMRDKFEFYGVSKPTRAILFKNWWNEKGKSLSRQEFWDVVFNMWDATCREEQYWAVEMLLKLKKSDFQEDDLHKIQTLIVSKSWWDTVDLIASNTLTSFSEEFPYLTENWVDSWTESGNLWLKRATLIFQLKLKKNTKLELLSQQISFLKTDKEFFIQKAIGWALREVSKWNPEWVKQQIQFHDLESLAKREASKYL
jgi:3-methyladenine DNA glycosylase AlkD